MINEFHDSAPILVICIAIRESQCIFIFDSSGYQWEPFDHIKVFVRPANSARLPNFTMSLGRFFCKWLETRISSALISGKLRWYSGRCLLFGCILLALTLLVDVLNGRTFHFHLSHSQWNQDHHRWSIVFNTNHCIKTSMKLEDIWDDQSCVD